MHCKNRIYRNEQKLSPLQFKCGHGSYRLMRMQALCKFSNKCVTLKYYKC